MLSALWILPLLCSKCTSTVAVREQPDHEFVSDWLQRTCIVGDPSLPSEGQGSPEFQIASKGAPQTLVFPVLSPFVTFSQCSDLSSLVGLLSLCTLPSLSSVIAFRHHPLSVLATAQEPCILPAGLLSPPRRPAPQKLLRVPLPPLSLVPLLPRLLAPRLFPLARFLRASFLLTLRVRRRPWLPGQPPRAPLSPASSTGGSPRPQLRNRPENGPAATPGWRSNGQGRASRTPSTGPTSGRHTRRIHLRYSANLSKHSCTGSPNASPGSSRCSSTDGACCSS